MARVVISSGPGEGREFAIDRAAILGRLDTVDIPIKDGKASREHAKIYQQGREYAIVDLNSSNGTFVNGERVTKRVLKPGDEIAIGVVHLRFELDEEEAPKEAAPRRASADDVFTAKPQGAPAPTGGGAAPEIVLRGHQPLQYNRVKPGRTLVGFDLEQLSTEGRILVYGATILVFAALVYLAYTLVS